MEPLTGTDTPILTARTFIESTTPESIRLLVEEGLQAFGQRNFANAEYFWSQAERRLTALEQFGIQTDDLVELAKVVRYHHLLTHILLGRPRWRVAEEREKLKMIYGKLRQTLDLVRDKEMLQHTRRAYWGGRIAVRRLLKTSPAVVAV